MRPRRCFVTMALHRKLMCQPQTLPRCHQHCHLCSPLGLQPPEIMSVSGACPDWFVPSQTAETKSAEPVRTHYPRLRDIGSFLRQAVGKLCVSMTIPR